MLCSSFPLVVGGNPFSGQEEGKTNQGEVGKESRLFVETLRWSVFCESTDLLTGKAFQSFTSISLQKNTELFPKGLTILR